MLARVSFSQYGSLEENSNQVFKIVPVKELLPVVISFLSFEDKQSLKMVALVFHGPIKKPDYAKQYSSNCFNTVSSICFMGECFYGEIYSPYRDQYRSYYPSPIPCYTWSLNCDYPSLEIDDDDEDYYGELQPTTKKKYLDMHNLPYCNKKQTENLKTLCNVASCMSCESIRCVCFMGKYSLGCLAFTIGFFAGKVKNSMGHHVRTMTLKETQNAKPKHQKMI